MTRENGHPQGPASLISNGGSSDAKLEHAVSLRGLRKKFGSATAVHDATIDVVKGELVSILGPSGCGKTTTLRMIAGFVAPDSGSVYMNGRDVTAIPIHKRNVGMVFQSHALFPHMTVAENVGFGLRMRRVPKTEARERIAESLALVGLADHASRLPKELSGGQQQRVALARAIVIRPEVLLLDEPLSALDAKLRRELRGEIRRIQQELNIATILVTHDQEEAMRMSDRIAVMEAGIFEQVDTITSIYNSPNTLFTARFVGDRNTLPCSIASSEADGSATIVVAGAGAFRARVLGQVDDRSRCEALLGREAIRISADPMPPTRAGNVVQAEVQECNFLGATIHHRCIIGDQIVNVSSPVVDKSPCPIRPGAMASLSWEAEDMMVFAERSDDRD